MRTIHKVGAGGAAVLASAAAIAMAVPQVKKYEGYWPTVRIDWIGTGHPATGGYGETIGIKVGETHSEAYWSALLAKRLPQYDAKIASCIHVVLPDGVRATLISMAYNAGPAAVCRSPAVARMNKGDIRGGCMAIAGWYIRASGHVIRGLINRRNDERAHCLNGIKT